MKSLETVEYVETRTVQTGRGFHLYYKGDGRTRGGVLPGIDIRGVGGYVVAPPSIHASGHVYEWVEDQREDLAPAPAWTLTGPGSSSTARARGNRSNPQVTPTGYLEGERNEGLFRRASSMRNIGLSEHEIQVAIAVANDELCDPPLSSDEVAIIAASAAKLPVGREVEKYIFELGLTTYAIAVYYALVSHVDWRGECYPGMERLARMTGMSRQTARKARQELEGLLVKTTSTKQGNRYRLLDPPQSAAATPSANNPTETRT
jgi:hypothetical protein